MAVTVSKTVNITASCTFHPIWLKTPSVTVNITPSTNKYFTWLKTYSKTVTITGSLTKYLTRFKSYSKTVNLTGSIVKQFGYPRSATVTTSGSLRRAITRRFSAPVPIVGGIFKNITYHLGFSTGVSIDPGVVKTVGKPRSKTINITPSASFPRLLYRTATATVSITASFLRVVWNKIFRITTVQPTIEVFPGDDKIDELDE